MSYASKAAFHLSPRIPRPATRFIVPPPCSTLLQLPPCPRNALKPYLIGRVAPTEATIVYDDALNEPFYEDLKQRVAKYFSDNSLHPRFSWVMQIKAGFILTGLVSTHLCANYLAPNAPVAVLCAAMCGVFMATIGTAI